MKEIRNKTHEPLRIRLPQGRVLHLGPNQTGQISDHAVDDPSVQGLVEAGKIEVLEKGKGGTGHGEDGSVHASTHGHPPNAVAHHKGER